MNKIVQTLAKSGAPKYLVNILIDEWTMVLKRIGQWNPTVPQESVLGFLLGITMYDGMFFLFSVDHAFEAASPGFVGKMILDNIFGTAGST